MTNSAKAHKKLSAQTPSQPISTITQSIRPIPSEGLSIYSMACGRHLSKGEAGNARIRMGHNNDALNIACTTLRTLRGSSIVTDNEIFPAKKPRTITSRQGMPGIRQNF